MSSTADLRPDAGARTRSPSTASAAPARGPARPSGARSRPSLSPSLTCWDCDAENPPERIFCIACGTFIAVGSKVFSRRSPGVLAPVAALATSAGPTMSLGSYSVAMRRYQQVQAGRRRLLMGLVAVVLAAVVGVAAIYLATTPRGPSADPAAALLVAPSASPASESEGKPTQRSLAGAAVVKPAGSATAEAQVAATPESTEASDSTLADAVTPRARATAGPSPADEETALEPGLVADPEETPKAKPLPVTERARETEQVTGTALESAPPATDRSEPRSSNRAVWRNGWVCDGELTLTDRGARGWTITRASFLPGNGYERVVLNLERVGSGSRGAATVRAEAFPTASVKRQVPRVRQPSAGKSTVALQLAGGIKSDLSLRSYRPKGLRNIKELSIYPVGRRSARVLVSAAADGCFKVRVPAWNGPQDARKAQIYIDVKS